MQQTPKPLAQEPAAVPPLLVHSDLQTMSNYDGSFKVMKKSYEAAEVVLRCVASSIQARGSNAQDIGEPKK